MFFNDYSHIELLDDDITISDNRKISKPSKSNKDREVVVIGKVKNWKPSNPFRLRVRASVARNGKRTIKKRTYVYEDIYMVDALKDAEKKHYELIGDIKSELKSPIRVAANNDKDEMFTFEKAFYRSLESRKLEAEAEGEDFRSYTMIKRFYLNHLTPLADIPLDKISKDTLNHIRANMKHKDGTPYAKKTKLTVLQNVNPVYTWFNDYSNLSAKSPARIPKGGIKRLANERRVVVDDIGPLFNAMANYTFTLFKKGCHTDPYRGIFVWLMHGRRVNEVLSLRWENINLDAGTYTITAANNKAKIDMAYKLTPYQIKALPEQKKSGLVYHARKDKTKQVGPDVLWTHWKDVREAVGTWTLNDKQVGPSELHIHDIRHLIATEMLNKYDIVDEISGAVLGHTRSGITARYAGILMGSVNDAIMKVLDGVLK